MVKLTQELIEQALQFTNPVRDRQLDLRGYKLPVIENLGATLDQFDTIDFTDNEIRKLDGFPLLKRLKCLLLSNNHIARIGENLEQNIPNLESLILTGNRIQELGDLDNLSTLKSLKTLSLLFCPVAKKKHYRLYVIFRLPQLKLLDFQKVKEKEREASAALFKGKKGQQLVQEIGKKSKTFVPGGAVDVSGAPVDGAKKPAVAAPGRQDIEAIKAAIAAATTLEDVERLNRMLQTGLVPSNTNGKTPNNAPSEVEEEEMDT